MTDAERYALGLMVEEMGETLKHIGKAMRFGLDVPGPDTPEYQGRTPREAMAFEMGDILAALHFANMHKIGGGLTMNMAGRAKLDKLLDPDAKDHRGNRLAPDPQK